MRKLKNRLAVLRLLLVLLFCAVAVYLAWLMQKPELLQAAAGQGSYTCTAGTAAGTIYDRNGVPLVNTRSVCTAVVSPTPEAAEALLPHVLDAEAFYEKLAQGKPFTCTVDTADIACPDVTVLEIPQRYTTPQPAQHVIGYTQEGKGVAGLESAYDAVLRGVDSQWSVTFSVDGKGKPLAGEAAQVRYGANPVQGVMTTLDIRMQRICETAGASLQKGCVVVMDVESGDILGLASFPGYTPDALGEAMQDPDSPMIQRALYAYPVGSIFKLVTAACAYENGAETAFQWNCNGAISIGSQRFRCHDPQGHGLQNLADAMRNSCNPYFIGADVFRKGTAGNGKGSGLRNGNGADLQHDRLQRDTADIAAAETAGGAGELFVRAGRSHGDTSANHPYDMCHCRKRYLAGCAAGAWRDGKRADSAAGGNGTF